MARNKITPPIERFLKKVSFEPMSGCWLWLAALNPEGYAEFFDGITIVLGHRWAYEHWIGPIPNGLVGDHLCRVRCCVNPRHIDPVTQAINLERAEIDFEVIAAKNRERAAAITHCPAGHIYDESNTHISRDGKRNCRACDRLKKTPVKLPPITHCPKGHEYTPGNTRLTGRNKRCRQCKTCHREQVRNASRFRRAHCDTSDTSTLV